MSSEAGAGWHLAALCIMEVLKRALARVFGWQEDVLSPISKGVSGRYVESQ